MKKSFQQNRRDFISKMGLMSGAALTAGALPTAVLANPGKGKRKTKMSSEFAYHPDIVDPALENFPGYAAHIPSGRAHLLADAGHNILDTQFLV